MSLSSWKTLGPQGSGLNPNLGTNRDILSKWVIIAILNSLTTKWWNYPFGGLF